MCACYGAEMIRNKTTPVSFLWLVPVQGFRWRERSRPQTWPDDSPGADWAIRVLETNTNGIESPSFRTYSPLELRAGGTRAPVHEQFAALHTRGEILAFANRYGLLTGQGPESEEFWRTEIQTMWQAIGIWESLRSKKWGQLFVSRAAENQMESLLAKKEFQDAGTVKIEDLAARLQQILAEKLRSISPRADVNLSTKRFSLRYEPEPTSLLDAIWLLFAWSVTGERAFSKCERCGKWLRLSGSGRRRRQDAQFCNDRCRAAAYSALKTKVRNFRRDGVSLREIAAEHALPFKTVRRMCRGVAVRVK